MDYSVDDIVRKAKIAIDQNVSSQELASLGDTDTLTLDEIIRSKVEDAARLVEEGAAHYLLDGGQNFGGAIERSGMPAGAGRIKLDSTFLRLVVFQMSDWVKAATDVITEDDPAYLLQRSRYAGIRGNSERPAVAIIHTTDGPVLEYYGSSDTSIVKRFLYIPIPKIETKGTSSPNDDTIALCPKLYRAVVYRLASMTAAIIGASDVAAMLLGTSNELAGVVS